MLCLFRQNWRSFHKRKRRIGEQDGLDTEYKEKSTLYLQYMRQRICSANPVVHLLNLERSLSRVCPRAYEKTNESITKRIVEKVQRPAEIYSKYLKRWKSFRWQSKGSCKEFDSKSIFYWNKRFLNNMVVWIHEIDVPQHLPILSPIICR